MQASSSDQTVDCTGRCLFNLTVEELDQITDNINKTLSHPKGRRLFVNYLLQCNLQSRLECFELYQICSDFLAKELNESESKNSNVDSLSANVMRIRELVENLDGVPQIDMTLMKQFNKALTDKDKDALLAVLDDTKERLQDHLKDVHKSFKQYISEPCAMTRK